jgi:hypothetical protein
LKLNQIAGKIFDIVDKTGLKELGKLEQDLVFGDAGAKEVINFLRVKQVIAQTQATDWPIFIPIGNSLSGPLKLTKKNPINSLEGSVNYPAVGPFNKPISMK